MVKRFLLSTLILFVVCQLPAQQYESFKDPRDGKVYKTVKIGTQEWMAENLNVVKFRNGDLIQEAKTDQEWNAAGKAGKPAWCYLNNDPANGLKYGKLYNWFAVHDSRGLAPEGWHIPTIDEWKILYKFLGEEASYEKLKTKQNWSEDNGLNTSGFSSLPSGIRQTEGEFSGISTSARYWSSTTSEDMFGKEDNNAWHFAIDDEDVQIGMLSENTGMIFIEKRKGFSIRCVNNRNIPNTKMVSSNLPSVTIGSQAWSTKNLNVDKFRNGDPIPQAKTVEEWQTAAAKRQPAWCYYNNEVKNGAVYGKLYNWFAVVDPRGLAPIGWHIPSLDEWNILYKFLGSNYMNKMKSNNGGWMRNYDTDNGNNSSGFCGLPGGLRYDGGVFNAMKFIGKWWSSTTSSSEYPNYMKDGHSYYAESFYLGSVSELSGLGSISEMGTGMSVRCIKDY